jgi:membrane associated rhomboid family serine protease
VLLPIGLEDSEVNRLPWVTLGIAGVCVLAFLTTWVLPGGGGGERELQSRFHEVAQYWREHPSVEVPPRLKSVVSPVLLAEIARARGEDAPPSTPEEQATFDSLVTAWVSWMDHQPLRHYALVPARGFAQVGWLTYMFLHFGWAHILGNFLFLYLVGPFLEDAWGRPLYGAFYVTGGLVAGLTQVLAERHAYVIIAGASGAIAACMGAFMLRFAMRRVRMAYFFWFGLRPLVGTFLMRAWVWGLLWFGSEILSLILDGARGGAVAVMAHVGGFMFGAAFAFGLRASGIERKHVAPSVEKSQQAWAQHPAVERALAAMGAGDRAGARTAFSEALTAQPDNRDAALGLARLDLEEGAADAGSRRLERALAHDLARNDTAAIRVAVEDLGPAFHPEALRPATAYRIAQALEAEGNPALAEMTFAASGAAGGPLGAKGLLRAAELRLASHTEVTAALGYLDRLSAVAGAPAEVLTRGAALRASVLVHDSPGGGRFVALETPAAEPATPGKASIRQCRLLAMDADTLQLEDEAGGQVTLALRQVLAVATAIIPALDGSGRQTVLTDLLSDWGGAGRGPAVIRLPGGALGLPKLYPEVRPSEAYGLFLKHVLERSGATGLPDKANLASGAYPRYADVAAFEAACYRPP